MQIVMCYNESDGCTYSADHTYPFEYESAEAALVEFERLFNSSGGLFLFMGMEFFKETFRSGRTIHLPYFYTVPEWFESRRVDR